MILSWDLVWRRCEEIKIELGRVEDIIFENTEILKGLQENIQEKVRQLKEIEVENKDESLNIKMSE